METEAVLWVILWTGLGALGLAVLAVVLFALFAAITFNH